MKTRILTRTQHRRIQRKKRSDRRYRACQFAIAAIAVILMFQGILTVAASLHR